MAACRRPCSHRSALRRGKEGGRTDTPGRGLSRQNTCSRMSRGRSILPKFRQQKSDATYPQSTYLKSFKNARLTFQIQGGNLRTAQLCTGIPGTAPADKAQILFCVTHRVQHAGLYIAVSSPVHLSCCFYIPFT